MQKVKRFALFLFTSRERRYIKGDSEPGHKENDSRIRYALFKYQRKF